MGNNSLRLKKLCISAMLCAVAFVLVLTVRINVQFLTLDIKDSVLCVIALLFGPLYGVVASAVVSLIEFFTISGTGVYGLIMNFISSAAFTLVAGFVYYRRRNLKAATVGLILSVIFMTAFMLVANYFITPYYMNASTDAVVSLILPLLLPFNLLKGVLNAALTLIIYKPVSSAVKRFMVGAKEYNKTSKKAFSYLSAIITSIAAIIICIAILVLLLKFNGKINLF